MKKFILILVCLLSPNMAHAEFEKITTITDPQIGPVRQADALDLNFEYKYTRMSGKNISGISMRAGYMRLSEPYIFFIGPVAQLSTRYSASFGIQAEIENLWSGLWAQGAILTNENRRIIGDVAVGFSLFGIDAQINDEQDSFAVFAKVKVPMGLILLYLYNRE